MATDEDDSVFSAEWLDCNKCHVQRVSLHLTNCGHSYCSKCKETGSLVGMGTVVIACSARSLICKCIEDTVHREHST